MSRIDYRGLTATERETLRFFADQPRIGSLFSGYGGLDLGVQAVVGGKVAWHVEFDDAPSKILEHRFPGVPNFGDITTVDWSTVEPVDVLVGGFPCQDLSLAGRRAGMRPGTRSGLWGDYLKAIDALRPGLVVIENVRGLLSGCAESETDSDLGSCPRCSDPDATGRHAPNVRALGRVLLDLARIGYVGRWTGLRAADAGAPHGRFRVFIIAHPKGQPWRIGNGDDVRAGSQALGREPATGRGVAAHARGETIRLGAGLRASEQSGLGWGRLDNDRVSVAPADADGVGPGEGRPEPTRRFGRPEAEFGGDTLADSAGGGRDGRSQDALGLPLERVAVAWSGGATRAAADTLRDRRERRRAAGDVAGAPRPGEGNGSQREWDGDAVDDREHSPLAWGDYEPAIRRWEHVTGRVAPAPTRGDGRDCAQRLSPVFVEWMMGLPEGWLTDPDVGLTRAQQLKALGNGVVPQQAELAVRTLLAAEAVAA